MPIRIVQSKQNARLKELRRALASPGRNDGGLAGIEGPHLLTEAMRAGLYLRCVFVALGSEGLAEALGVPEQVEVLAMPREILDPVLRTETPQPIAALVEPPDWTWAHLLGNPKGSAPLIVVMAGLQDPGNLGTIIRSAEAFEASGVVCLPGTVSLWNPKTVRASAGSVLRMPVVSASETDVLDRLRAAGVRILATTAQGAQPAEMVDLAKPVALVIGNEGNGVPAGLTSQADGAITIPCPGPVESLNAAVAASVLLYEAARQRAAKIDGPRDRRGAAR